MTERPILFSGPMVRAILDGRKTQTRRLLRLPPPADTVKVVRSPSSGRWFSESAPWTLGDMFPGADRPEQKVIWRGAHGVRCPYGQPGDRLWVRETWGRSTDLVRVYVYAADQHVSRFDILGERWTPSIHMPRAASRLSLEVTSVRVERLQNISEEDALAEGIREDGEPWASEYGWGVADRRVWAANTARQRFEYAWDRINGDRATWDSNPWVWCVGFKRVEAADAHR